MENLDFRLPHLILKYKSNVTDLGIEYYEYVWVSVVFRDANQQKDFFKCM